MIPLELPPDELNLSATLDCGQAFRWTEQPDGSWAGAAGNRYLRLRREGTRVLLSCGEGDAAYWRNYFDAGEAYREKLTRLKELHPVLAEAAALYPGVRILRQEPWEALCSFLISQNNNIPRIKGILGRFCRLFGEPIPETDEYAFPRPEALLGKTVEDLAPLRAGYRAKYLLGAAEMVCCGGVELAETARLPAAYGRDELQKLPGVGPKVAECVLLYGFHKTECFPMDVWMKRAMAALLPGRVPADFGEDAGLAQQLIFHYSRNHPELFSEKAKSAGVSRSDGGKAR